MSDKALFYNKIVPLNETRHKKLSCDHNGDYSFTSGTNAVFLSQMEFPRAAREYPIVFAGNDDQLLPFAIVGLKNAQNLFLNEQSRWEAEYIPAYVRRYPFLLAVNGTKYTVCIDETFPGFNEQDRGERLFDEEGEQSEYLKKMLEFLNHFQMDHQRTLAFVAKLRDYDLLEPMHANVSLHSGEKLSLREFFVVSRDKLKALEGDKVADLMKTDAMERIYTHIVSLENFNLLMNRYATAEPKTE